MIGAAIEQRLVPIVCVIALLAIAAPIAVTALRRTPQPARHIKKHHQE